VPRKACEDSRVLRCNFLNARRHHANNISLGVRSRIEDGFSIAGDFGVVRRTQKVHKRLPRPGRGQQRRIKKEIRAGQDQLVAGQDIVFWKSVKKKSEKKQAPANTDW
jgi:hypothetical protein